MGLNFKEVCNIITPEINKIPTNWDGKNAILEMKNGNARWRDMEWIGFYFEFLCKKFLSGILKMPYSKKYGNVEFDGFLEFPWDFKAHATQSGKDIIINDSEAISNAVRDFGHMGIIIATGPVVYDNESKDFKKWHDELKGKKSAYEIKRIERGARSTIRKRSMNISKMLFVRINDEVLIKSGSFQENFRNSSGTPRRKKVLLDLKKIDNQIEHVIEYN